MRFEDQAVVVFQEFHHFAVLVTQVAVYPGLCRTVLDTCRVHAFFQPVKAQGAFVHDFLFGVDIPAAVGACLYAVATANAVIVINKHEAFRTVVCSPYRAYLHAGRLMAMVAKLWHEERLKDLIIRYLLFEAFHSTIGRFNVNLAISVDGILLDPCPEVIWLVRDIVFILAGNRAAAAANSFFNIDAISVPGALAFRLFTCNDNSIER